MNHALILFAFALLQACSLTVQCRAEEPLEKPLPQKLAPEERRRRYEALKKELEAFRPAQDAERDEVLVYLQQVLNASSTFARENPHTTEGFEAASSGALQLAARGHPKSAELAQVALEVAPAAGVEQRQVAICWLLVANGSMINRDFKAARAALEKIKVSAPDLYALAEKQLEENEAKEKPPDK